MKLHYLILSLAPAPLFYLLGFASLWHGSSMCGAFVYEMPLMWFVMGMAHTLPWFTYFDQRRYRRYSQLEKPVKQQ